MKAYKATYNYSCRNQKYEVGKYYQSFNYKMCAGGIHFCLNLIDIFNYYDWNLDTKVIEIEILGDTVFEDDKGVTNKIKVIREVPISEYYPLLKSTYNKSDIDCIDFWENGNIKKAIMKNGYYSELSENGLLLEHGFVDGSCRDIFEYNEFGKILKETKLADCGQTVLVDTRYIYDDQQRLISIELFGPSKYRTEQSYTYNEDGTYSESGIYGWSLYNKQGNLLEKRASDKDSTLIESNEYWEDGQTHKCHKKYTPCNCYETHYNENGKILKEYSYTQDGVMCHYLEYIRDYKGRLQHKIQSDKSTEHFSYNPKGELISIVDSRGWIRDFVDYSTFETDDPSPISITGEKHLFESLEEALSYAKEKMKNENLPNDVLEEYFNDHVFSINDVYVIEDFDCKDV